MALATEHMESKNRWNYRTFNSLDTIWEEILMKFAYDKSKAQHIINHEEPAQAPETFPQPVPAQ